MNPSSGDKRGAASAAPLTRRARPEWRTLSDPEKIERLGRDLAFAEKRVEKLEAELDEAGSRLRMLLTDIGRSEHRLRTLRRAYELGARLDEQDALVIHYTSGDGG
jgi:chromosome segregation ATPase